MKITEEALIKVCEFFYQKVTGFQDFEFRLSKQEEVALSNFVKKIESDYKGGVGIEWIYRYFGFQFLYWRGKETREGKGAVRITWLIGKKAYERWQTKNPNYWYFVKNGLLREDNITRKDIEKILGYEEPKIFKNSIFVFEEIEKERFYGTEEGFANCRLSTTLYSPYSQLCLECIFKQECKELATINFQNTLRLKDENKV